MAENAFVKPAVRSSTNIAAAPSANEPARAPASWRRSAAGRLRPSQVPVRPIQEVLRGGGQPLSAPLREEMEARLGTDLSDVRVHADDAARATATAVGARAYTCGSHVVIGEGGADRHTLAHELSHVIQQRQGAVAGTDYGNGLRVSGPSDRDEQAAEAEAARVMRAPPGQHRAAAAETGEQRIPAARPGGAVGVVQRALDHTKQATIGFGAATERPVPTDARVRVSEAWLWTDGTVPGSEPFDDPEGYGYIRSLHLTNFWIRFHLVNEKAGGPGAVNNLVPASKRDNSRYEQGIEAHLKDDVNDAATTMGDEVFFGVKVNYHTLSPPGATPQQQQNAPFFPTSLMVSHERFDATAGTWSKDKLNNNLPFFFKDPEPTDTTNPVAITSLDLAELKNRVPGFNWDNDDVAFLKSLGGTRKTEFEGIIDKHSGAGPAESVKEAFEDTNFSLAPPSTPGSRKRGVTGVMFAERINNQKNGEKALSELSRLIAQGAIYL